MEAMVLRIAGIIAACGTVGGSLVYFGKVAKRLSDTLNDVQEGVKCMLRAAMLNTYYKGNGTNTITQYEFQNFELQYAAYKRLGGNSFVDKIHEDIKKDWDIVQ